MFDVQNPKTGEVYSMENENEAKTALTRGYIPLSVKHPKTGEMFNLENADEVTKAIKSGYMPAFEPPKPPKAKTTTWQDMATTFDPTLGFKDEVWGAVGALFDPSDVGGSFTERYEQYRDAQRGAVSSARESSPKATAVSEFAGSVPSMLIPGAAGAKAAKAGIDILRPVAGSSVLMGAVEGAGRSEAQTAEGYAKDIATGAAVGAALPAALKGASLGTKAAMGAKELVTSLPRVFSGALKDKGEALTKAAGDIVSVFGNNAALKQAVGVGPKATDLEIRKKIFDELSAEGTTPFKRWLSEEIATKSGSTGTADQLEELFALGSKARSEARAFGPEEQKSAAESLTEALKGFQSNVGQVRGEAFKEGMETAAKQFKTLPVKTIQTNLKKLQSEAEAYIPAEGEVSLLGEADQKKIMDAMRIIYQGDIKGIQKVFPKIQAGDNPTTEQLFWRLQAARQMIDKWGKKLNREGFNEQAVAMDGFRSKIDDLLKLSDEKRATDVLYREGKEATVPLFKGVTTKADGERFIDTTKVQGVFGGTRKAEEFGRRMDQVQSFLEESGLPFDPDIKGDVFKQFKDVTTTAANRRLVESMKRQGGPSAQAIEALAGQKAKNIVQEIIIRPSAVLQKIDEEISRRGGTFSEKELADLSKWRSMFEKLAENSGRGVLPSDAWSLGLSFAASKIGVDFIKKYIQTQGE
jgi:hypothetical protein